jgi:outer membrane immunogenic protein
MKKILLGTVALAALGLAVPAVAADIPAKAPMYSKAPAMVAVYNWTGFYVGLQAGYAWTSAPNAFNAGAGFVTESNANGSGWKLGGHAGYNFQTGQVVLGIEGDLEWANIKGNDAGVGGNINELEVRWQGSVRGRVGYAFNNALLYGTGGWAFGGANSNVLNAPTESVSKSISGWTAGAGLEMALAHNFTGRVEYRYTDFGRNDFVMPVNGYTERFDIREHALRVGVTYKFGGPVVAKY